MRTFISPGHGLGNHGQLFRHGIAVGLWTDWAVQHTSSDPWTTNIMSALSHLLFANVCYRTNKLKKKNVDLFLSPRKNGDLPTSMIVILLAPVFRWRRRNISRSFFWVTAGGEPTKGQKIKKQKFTPSTSKGTVSRVCSKCFRGSSSRKLGQDAWTEWEGRRFFFSFPFRFFF